MLALWCSLLCFLWVSTETVAFNFTFGDGLDPTACEVSPIRWYGGKPPFSLTLVPIFNYPTNISIPDDAWDSSTGEGLYEYHCDYPSGRQLVAFMSDATGMATGGATNIMEVQNPPGTARNASCVSHVDASSFKFYLNETSLTQCETVEIYWDPTATDPVNIIAVNPGGQVLQIPAKSGQTYINWKVNLPANTDIIMAAFDGSVLGQGGSGQSLVVQESGDFSCLASSVPIGSQTGSPTGSRAPVVTVTTTQVAQGSKKPVSTSGIVGIVVGFFIILQGLLYWFCCRKPLKAYREARKQRAVSGDDDQRARPLNLVDSRTTHGTRDQDDYTSSPADDQPTMSPFWDGAAVNTDSPHYTSERGGVSSENLISPVSATALQHPYPPRAALRSDSMGFSTPARTTSPPYPSQSDRSDSAMPLADLLASASSSRQQTKNGMVATNPDAGMEGDARPLPRGGWRRHQDGGPAPAPRRRPEDEVLELPPLYDELWTPSGSSAATDAERSR